MDERPFTACELRIAKHHGCAVSQRTAMTVNRAIKDAEAVSDDDWYSMVNVIVFVVHVTDDVLSQLITTTVNLRM